MSIRTKLLLVFLVLSLGPLAVVGFFAYETGRRSLRESLGHLFEEHAARAIETLDREADAARRGAAAWRRLELMQDVLTDDPDGRVSAFLIEQARGSETIAEAVVVDPEWTVKAASRPDWLGRGVEPLEAPGPGGWACRDGALEAPARSAAIFTCSFPIRAAFDGDVVIGQLVVSFDMGPAIGRLQVQEWEDDPPVEMVFLRSEGPVIPADSGERPVHSDLFRGTETRAGRLSREGGSGFVVERLGGRDHLVGYSRSSGITGWSALVGQHVSEAFAPIDRLRLVVLGLASVIAGLVVFLSFRLAQRVTSPILELTCAARRVAAGDLDPTLPPRSTDEIGDLVAGFAHMAGELRAQRTQLVEKDYLDSIVSHLVDGLIVVDAEGMLRSTNPALYQMAGQDAAALIGQPAAGLFAEGDEGFRTRVLEAVGRDGEVRDVELGLLDGAGRAVPVSLSAGALPPGPAGPGAVVCILTDITERKRTEEALVRAREDAEAGARAKARFLATMSHEIRTPLNGVIGMMELLVGSRLDPRQRDYAETAQRSGEALLAIVGDILDYSKLEAGGLELESLDFEPRTTLEEVADTLAPRAREKNLELAVVCEPGLPARVKGDERRLRQVLLNLGSNAVKFTPRGHVILRASVDPSRPSGLRFEVEDSGIGVAPEGRDRLFRPFSQVDASTTRKYGGTGLGLAISRQLVELMGGTIGFDTEEGRGSTFRVSVPLPTVEAASLPGRGTVSGLRILVVDDSETNRHLLCEMLERWGCQATSAADGWEALQLLREAARAGTVFDIVLLDFQMPEMDGAQVAGEIRKDPRLASVPLVLLTSVPQQGATARQMGFSACLAKPIKGNALRQAIEATLGPRGEADEGPGPSPPTPTKSRGRILVVDDDPTSRRVALELLERLGCRCDAAPSGEAAIEALERETYDLVFMDCQMPEVDGYETTRRIRQKDRHREDLVIVAMTGDAFGEDRVRCLQAGMNDHVAKPVRTSDFERILDRYLTVRS